VLIQSIAVLSLLAPLAQAQTLPRLKVSDNHRFLVTQDGKPFFYLADTAWELFHRLDRQQAVQSSTWFHSDEWLDFNMQQTGHGLAENTPPWLSTPS
jgi:hypothetical protein